MLHGSQTIGLNWRGFRYATWAELAAVAVFVGLFLVDGQLSRGFEFGVVGVIAYLICNWANPIPTFHAFLVVATAVLNAAGWTVPALARYNSCLHLLSRENRRGCTLHQRLRTQVGSCAVPPKCSYGLFKVPWIGDCSWTRPRRSDLSSDLLRRRNGGPLGRSAGRNLYGRCGIMSLG